MTSNAKTRNHNPYAQMLEISSGMATGGHNSHLTLPSYDGTIASTDFKNNSSFSKSRNRMVRIQNLYTANEQ